MVDPAPLPSVNCTGFTAMKPRPALTIFLVGQALLIGIELLTRYDTTMRQSALAVTNIIATVGLLWLDRWLRRRGSQLSWLTIVMIAAAVWLDALGNFQHWYAQFWWYDRLTHAAGGMAVSGLFIDLLLARFRQGVGITSWWLAVWFGFLLGQFVASMYEVSEWLGDMWFATERVRGPFDAPRDLFFNLVGGLVVVGLFWLTRKKPTRQ